LRVRDTGTGIPAEALPRIFDPFFTTKDDQNRTGLGLAVAAGIVEQHAGEITVHSTPGEGAEFRIALPAAAGVTAVSIGCGAVLRAAPREKGEVQWQA
jgi:signal transduction histidine kinase